MQFKQNVAARSLRTAARHQIMIQIHSSRNLIAKLTFKWAHMKWAYIKKYHGWDAPHGQSCKKADGKHVWGFVASNQRDRSVFIGHRQKAWRKTPDSACIDKWGRSQSHAQRSWIGTRTQQPATNSTCRKSWTKQQYSSQIARKSTS